MIADHYMQFLVTVMIFSQSTLTTINQLEPVHAKYGVPKTVISDDTLHPRTSAVCTSLPMLHYHLGTLSLSDF